MITHESLERQLEAAQKITHIGSWEWDARTNNVFWSDELYRIYGLEPRSCDITFETFLARVHPDDRTRIVGEVRAALERGCGPFAYHERVIRPDGSIRELDTKGEVACDESGRALGLIGTCRDVTDELKQRELLLLYANIVRDIQIGLSVWKIDDPDEISKILLVSYNPASERIVGKSLSDWIGKSLPEIVPYAADRQLHALLVDVAKHREVREGAVYRSRDPSRPNRALSMKAFPLPGNCVGVALEDITEATRARRLREAEQRIFEMIAQGAALSELLAAVTLSIEEHSPPMLASILLLAEDGLHVRHGAAPSLPAAYNGMVDGLPIGDKQGSCGTAMYTRKPVFVSDIQTDPLWANYRHIAAANRLCACWSSPVLASDGRVLGSFALYYREPRAPSLEDEALIARAVRITGIAIERSQLVGQLRALSTHVEAVREEERTSIAREVHDELGQSLTVLKMDAAWLGRRAAESAAISNAVVSEQMKSMSSAIDTIIGDVRRISSKLRPGVLDELGLAAAIEWQAHEFERRTGTSCAVSSNMGERALDAHLATTVFRIFQESLTNVARHAEAKHVQVRLEYLDGWIELEVRDDGKGISAAAAGDPRSLGLLGARERARNFGGTVSIEGRPAGGTTLLLRIPLEPLDEGDS